MVKEYIHVTNVRTFCGWYVATGDQWTGYIRIDSNGAHAIKFQNVRRGFWELIMHNGTEYVCIPISTMRYLDYVDLEPPADIKKGLDKALQTWIVRNYL